MKLLLVALGALVLASCNTANQAQINQGIMMSFAVACAGVDPSWVVWKSYESRHKISANDSAKVAGAYAAAKAACNSPPDTPIGVIQSGVAAAIAFKNAVDEAKQ